jgi:hypothetical protein
MVQFFRTWRGGIAGTMISKGNHNPEYLLVNDEEPLRLERQARSDSELGSSTNSVVRTYTCSVRCFMSRRVSPDYSLHRPAHGLNRC